MIVENKFEVPVKLQRIYNQTPRLTKWVDTKQVDTKQGGVCACQFRDHADAVEGSTEGTFG